MAGEPALRLIARNRSSAAYLRKIRTRRAAPARFEHAADDTGQLHRGRLARGLSRALSA